MARTPLSGPVIAVELDGRTAAWCDGFFTGDKTLVTNAKQAAEWGLKVAWGRLPEPEAAGFDTPREALAALMATNPGRTAITEWPDDLREWWQSEHVMCTGERLSLLEG